MADLPPYRHDHINIYPAATISAAEAGIGIDGDLEDWKPEAFVTMAADLDNMERYAMRVAAAYDDQGLLLAVRYTDDTPLVNRVDPIGQPDKGWAGDSFQIRFITDPTVAVGTAKDDIVKDPAKNARVVHLTLWQNSDGKLPALHVAYGWDFHAARVLTGADSLFKFALVDGGYAMEGRLPWSLLGLTTMPTPGTGWVMTLQGNWSGGGVNDLGHSFYDLVSAAGFPYQTSANWGRGHFVKADDVAATLAAQTAAEKTLWAAPATDGTAVCIPVRYTNPVKGYVSLAITVAASAKVPGGAIVRTLLTKVERSAGEQTELWDGRDDDGQPVPAGSYQIRALTQDGLKPRFVASVHNSGTPPWTTDDGTGSMSGDHGNPIGAAADAAGNVYLLWTVNELGSGIQCMNAAGRKIWGGYLDWGVFDGINTALAYDDEAGVVYVAMDGANNKPDQPNRGGIYAYHAKTGRRASLCGGKDKLLVTEWPKELLKQNPPSALSAGERMRAGDFGPADIGANLIALAVGGNRIYASLYWDDTIVALDRATGQAVASYPVSKPAGLAYDAARQRLYAVSGDGVVALNLGNPSSSRTSSHVGDDTKTGEVSDKVGDEVEKAATLTPPPSTLHPQPLLLGLDHPFGLALDKEGDLYVSVRGRRMQVLVFSPDGKHKRRIGKDGGRPWLGRYDAKGMLMPSGITVDAAGRLWVMEYDATPKRVSRWQTRTGKLEQEYFGNAAYSPMMAPDPAKPEEVYIHNTRFIVNYDNGSVTPDATVFRRGWHESALPGPGGVYLGFMGNTFQLATIGGRPFATDGGGGLYAVGRDEFRPVCSLADRGQRMRGYGMHDIHAGGAMLLGGRLYRPTGLSRQGVPKYPLPTDAPEIKSDGLKGYYRIDTIPSLTSDFQEFYTLAAEKYDGKTRDGVGKQGLYKLVNGGEVLWRYSRVAIDFATKSMPARSGDLFGALRVAGQAKLPEKNGGEMVAVSSYWGYYSFVSGDGLFLGDVGQDMRRGPKPSHAQTYVENFSGYFFRHPKSGKLYLFGGDIDGRIWEITGWESIRRIAPAPVTVTEAQHRKVVQAKQGAVAAARVTTLAVTAGAPAVDATTAARIDLDEAGQAKVALGYDAERLHALFQVPDRSPWQNSSSDWRYAFKGGDALDIQLGPGSETKPVQPGDVRIVIAPAEGEKGFVAFGMWPKVAGGITAEPQLYKSPVREVRFERVALLPGVACHVEKSGTGFVARIGIPWKDLGLAAPAKGATLRGDIGVLVSDAGGQRTVLRRFLFNPNTTITMDAPTEAEVEPQHWGLLKFE